MGAERWAARSEMLRPVSEWAAKELVVALSISFESAEKLLDSSLTLVNRLPATLAALEAGALHAGHLWPMLDKVAPIESDDVRAEVEACLLGWAAGRVTTPAQLGAKAQREVARRDARGAARRLTRAMRERGVYWRPEHVDGMGSVGAVLTMPESQALYEALGAYADSLDDDPAEPPRTRAQKMADCLMDLVLRPGETDLPPVQVLLTVVASVGSMLGGDEPGEVSGQPVPAEMVRQLLRGLTGRRSLVTAEPPAPGDPPAPDGRPADTTDDRIAAASPPRSEAAGAGAHEPAPEPESGSESLLAPEPESVESDTGSVDEIWQEAWQEIEQRELSAWADVMQRRILAGELEDPDPLSDDELLAWAHAAAAAVSTVDANDDMARLEPVDGADPGPGPSTGGLGAPANAGALDLRPASGAGLGDRDAFADAASGDSGPAWGAGLGDLDALADAASGDSGPASGPGLGDLDALLADVDLTAAADLDEATALRARNAAGGGDRRVPHGGDGRDSPEPGRPRCSDGRTSDPPPSDGGFAQRPPDPPVTAASAIAAEACARRPPDGTPWWAEADRAVDEAGRALLQAERAMAHARRVVHTASVADDADEAAWRAGPSGRVDAAHDALEALEAAVESDRIALADLLTRTGGGGLAERPRIALTDALSGALLALTDLPGLRRSAHCGADACRRRPEHCDHDLTGRPGLGAPGPTDGYRPGAELDRWVRARDRRCRFPGCRRRVPKGGELDHDQPYPVGPTSADNLTGYCTTDHRGKHQAPGWRRRLDAEGTLTVTTPTGLVAATTPPPY